MNNKFGFHARNMKEFKRLAALPYVSVLEIKPEKFEEPFYIDLVQKITLNEPQLEEIALVASENNIDVQFHMPPDYSDKQLLTPVRHSNPNDFKRLLQIFDTYLDMNELYDIGSTLTMHGPLFEKDGETLCNVPYALHKGNMIYKMYASMIKDRGLDIKVGLENVVGPKTVGANYASSTQSDFIDLLRDTPFGVTYDTGHMKLNNQLSSEFLACYYKIHNVHLHTNDGDWDPDSFDDDQHKLATPYNIEQFDEVKRIVQRDNSSVICEISKLGSYKDEELNHYLWHLKSYLKK